MTRPVRENEPMPEARTILILSFSPIATDARVLKQVRLAGEFGEVVTCGYGPRPDGVREHVRIPDGISVFPLAPKLLVLRLGALALRRSPAVSWAASALRGRRFDAIIADDLEALPAALRVHSAAGVLADLHEFSPGQHSNDAGWMRWVRPVLLRIVRRSLPRAAAVTTVAPIIADEYSRLSGVDVGVVINATPFADLQPTPVGHPLRLVHSGVCLRNRRLELLIEAVALSGRTVELDLYLMPNDPGHLQELRDLAEAVPGVRVREPVPYGELVERLNDYDLGVFVLPPTTRNYEWALPNKLFDFVQARLGVLIGPTPQMAHYVEAHHLGIVTDDFTAESLARVISTVTDEEVAAFKQAAHIAAQELSAEVAVDGWRTRLARMLERTR